MDFERSAHIEDDIKEIFHAWDLDENGFIDGNELARCCSDLSLTSEQINTLFDELDVDGDKQISLQDFSKGFQRVYSLFQEENELSNAESRDSKKFNKLLDALGVRDLLSG